MSKLLTWVSDRSDESELLRWVDLLSRKAAALMPGPRESQPLRRKKKKKKKSNKSQQTDHDSFYDG
jgi:hypothetical protein